MRFRAAGLLLVIAGACSVDEKANRATRCETGAECGDSERCYRGYCIGEGSDAPRDAGGDGAAPGGGDAGLSSADAGDAQMATDAGAGERDAGERCDAGEEDFCYTGDAGTELVGRCRPGKMTCEDGSFGACQGEVLPADGEQCNNLDDDCDGRTDEEAAAASCNTAMPGACAEGALLCAGGGAVCTQTVWPGTEVCNDVDDDCDGETDEGPVAQPSCYEGTAGCSDDDGDGVYTCSGICRAGVIACVDGEPGTCAGQVLPAATEDCSAPAEGELSGDEDCDGAIDEGCNCKPSDTRDCYSGPGGTAGVGTCQLGEQTCEPGGQWGPCANQTVPVTESCDNQGADDDCNGVMDDVPMRGMPCMNGKQMGRCRNGTMQCRSGALSCVTPEPRDETCDSTDDDCAGGIDEGFNVLADEENCGACGNPCDPGLTCCGGRCVNTQTDANHCNGCGNRCGGIPPCCRNGACNALLCL